MRPDKDVRSRVAFDLFNVASTRDWLCAFDYALSEGHQITRGLASGSTFRGAKYPDLKAGEMPLQQLLSDVAPALARDFKVPGYFSNQEIRNNYRSPRSFTHELYDRISVPWQQCVSNVPGVEYSIDLPPLLAIVLSRAASRERIPEVIKELHDELGPVRYELHEFDNLVRTETSQVALESKTARIQEAFMAIVPASRHQYARRTLARVWKLTRPLAKAYGLAINPTSLESRALA